MKKIVALLVAFVTMSCVCLAQTPVEVLDKAVNKINAAGNIDCKFTLIGDNGSVNGSLAAQGRKFRMTTPLGSSWYDGVNLWSSNPKTKEITLVNPSENEVREANPFSYLTSYKSEFRLFFSKRKDSSRYLVLLNPKARNSDIKAVEVAVNKKTFLPERFIIRDRNDNVTTVNVQSLSLKKNANESFKCPVGSMADYELVDLR
jgi:outer membrane lipoprotein-sorting protein